MLSPATWYQQVPKNLRENLLFRHYILRKCREPHYRQAVLYACKHDILFYICVFGWQYNPRKKGHEVGPFVTWDFQDDAIRETLRCIEIDDDLVIEKSREMGATWLFLFVMEWLWHFWPWKKFLCISRNQDAVEAEDPDSLFWKVDFILDHQPEWLKPAYKRRKLFYGNETNGSSITGQASTGKAGVGGRATAMFIDEFSQIEEDYEVLHRTSDTTGCRIFNGTHLGLDTAFYDLTQRVDIRKLRMHWTQHPDKNQGLYHYDSTNNRVSIRDVSYVFPADYHFVMDGSPTGGPFPGLRSRWYDKECKRKGSARAIAMDLDIDPKGSVSQFFDRLMIQRLIATHTSAPWWEGDIVYDHDTAEPFKLAQRVGGPLRLWCHLSHEGKPALDQYAAGADISAGSGATPSCLSIVRVSTGEKVAEYANAFIFPDKFAVLCVALCKLFKSQDNGGALFAWEQQGPGGVFGSKVMELNYYNIYYKTDDFEENAEETTKPGWYPAPANKRLLLEEYRIDLGTNDFLNHSKEALEECLSFKYDRRGMVVHGNQTGVLDPSGASVNHADRVIADGLANKMRRKLGQPSHKKPPPVLNWNSLQWRRELAERNQEKETA